MALIQSQCPYKKRWPRHKHTQERKCHLQAQKRGVKRGWEEPAPATMPRADFQMAFPVSMPSGWDTLTWQPELTQVKQLLGRQKKALERKKERGEPSVRTVCAGMSLR